MRILAILPLLLSVGLCYNNGVGSEKPTLGWQTWCAVGKCGLDLCTEKQIFETADALVASGMKDLGYEWIVLDDCIHPTRSLDGVLHPLKSSWPHGMKPVADYVHSKGLKFGIYTSVGTLTCRNDAGSWGFFEQDTKLFASWEVDYIKVDWCGLMLTDGLHEQFSKAMNKTGRHMWLELCRGPYQKKEKWGDAAAISQSWRSTGDHHDNWDSTMHQVMSVAGKSSWSGSQLYGWHYLDMLMTGGEGCDGQTADQALHCPKMTDNQYRTEFSLYAIVGSPLFVGTDIRNLTAIMKEVIFNPEVIAVNQDYKAKPGDIASSCGNRVWTRRLSNGKLAVVMPNLTTQRQTMLLCFRDIGWEQQGAHIRNLWEHSDVDVTGDKYALPVEPFDSAFFILS